jgi:HTH-type transcriptional regulator/antitoxin HigA
MNINPIKNKQDYENSLYRIEQSGLTRKYLEPFLGSRGRISEIFSKKRDLSLTMIRALHENLQIPLESLIH